MGASILWNWPYVSATKHHSWQVNISPGNNGLVQLDSKPAPEPVLTKIYVAKWRLYPNEVNDNVIIENI